jgi:hypothetical protein
MTNTSISATTQKLALSFIERADALSLKGKKRDDAALDYWCGAAIGAGLAGNTQLESHLGRIAALVISVRGFMAVKEIAAGTI